jgi:hypothetical protein
MDFLRKGAQAAKKLGNQLLEVSKIVLKMNFVLRCAFCSILQPILISRIFAKVVDGDVDHSAISKQDQQIQQEERKPESKADCFDEKDHGHSTSGSSSLEDAEFESAVKHFMAVNGNLKQLGMKAQAWVHSIKAQSSNGLAVGASSLEACRLEFEDEPTWIQAGEKLRDIAQLLDSKYASQLCSLLQRDILDPITAELETNRDTKSLVDSGRSGKLSTAQIDDAVGKLHDIMRRRKVLLAQCITVLSSHQYNYYVRLAEQFQSLQPFVADLKKRHSEMASGGKPQGQRDPQDGSSSPVAMARPPAKTQEASAGPAPPVQEEMKQPPVVEGDLLGMFGESSSTTRPAKTPAPSSKSGESQTTQSVDLLGGAQAAKPAAAGSVDLLGGAQAAKPAAAGSVDLLGGAQAAKPTSKVPSEQGDLLGDLFSPSQPRPARPAAAPASGAARVVSDPLADFLGTSAGATRGGQADLFGGMGGGSAGGGQDLGGARVNGDDEVGKATPQRPRAAGPNDFKGEGTSREALKQQFEAHVESKAQAAAAEIRKIDEDKKKYEDLKFQMAVRSDPSKLQSLAFPFDVFSVRTKL